MTEIDIAIGNALKELGIRRYPCVVLSDGRIEVKETTTKIGCVVETIVTSEQLDNGVIRIESLFYFFSKIKSDIDVLGDLNPKLMDIMFNIVKFKRLLKREFADTNYPLKKMPAMRMKTTALECGIELLISFDIYPPCN